jgi:hypothetical protein
VRGDDTLLLARARARIVGKSNQDLSLCPKLTLEIFGKKVRNWLGEC